MEGLWTLAVTGGVSSDFHLRDSAAAETLFARIEGVTRRARGINNSEPTSRWDQARKPQEGRQTLRSQMPTGLREWDSEGRCLNGRPLAGIRW